MQTVLHKTIFFGLRSIPKWSCNIDMRAFENAHTHLFGDLCVINYDFCPKFFLKCCDISQQGCSLIISLVKKKKTPWNKASLDWVECWTTDAQLDRWPILGVCNIFNFVFSDL